MASSIVAHIPGLVLIDHEFDLPLDYSDVDTPTITVFAREVVAVEHIDKNLPWLVYLQGGPGFGAPRPDSRSGWLALAVQRYRVLMLDQRGTARSSRVDADSLATIGDAAAQANYLAHFRADSIVHDAESIRRELCGDQPWTILGQSYGGFCAMHYLSFHADGLDAVIITGGVPAIGVPIDDVYRATYERVKARNAEYFLRYPHDRERGAEIVSQLQNNDVRLPTGARLTPRRFQQLGIEFGFSDGVERVHYLLDEAIDRSGSNAGLSHNFLHGMEHTLAYDTNPIFSILHEAIYCEGTASNWSAQRVRAEYPEFDDYNNATVLFTGEMIYPWMFEDYTRLVPLRDAAELIAGKNDWPRLYDQDALAANQVPVAAAVYSEDMFVERKFSEAVAEQVPNMRTWLTNEYQHNGLRADGERVLGRLLDMISAKN